MLVNTPRYTFLPFMVQHIFAWYCARHCYDALVSVVLWRVLPARNAEPLAPYVGEVAKLKTDNHIGPIVSKQIADVLTDDSTKVGRSKVG